MDNRTLETESVSSFFVIVADRDGSRKYVSKAFPRIFQYTIKINQAQRFNNEEQANKFITGFNDYGKYIIENPEIKKVYRKFTLLWNCDLVRHEEEYDNMNEYYIVSDGFFTYYINRMTGEKKFKLGKNDILVDGNFDNFIRWK